MSRPWKRGLWVLLAVSGILVAESFLPADSQPSARVCLGLIHAYQATGSPALAASGVRCRYTPTCSHYAADAIAHYGTTEGLARTAGRLWRCSPWGGCGYDPAVESHAAAYLAPAQQQQESEQDRKKREADEKKVKEDWDKAMKELGKEAPAAAAGCAFAGIMCVVGPIAWFVIGIILLLWVYKDSKARGDQNAVIWMVVVLMAHVVGLIVYLVVRPKGNLAICTNCRQQKLETLEKCPHCGVGAGAPPPSPAPPA